MSDNKALDRSGKITTHKVRMPHDLAIEAMQTILDYANDTKTDLVFVIAASMALDALKREAQPNDPLTLTELRGMDGEPVYISYPKNHCNDRWVISDGWDAEFNEFCSADGSAWSDYDYGKTWLAYRRKPDGGGE